MLIRISYILAEAYYREVAGKHRRVSARVRVRVYLSTYKYVSNVCHCRLSLLLGIVNALSTVILHLDSNLEMLAQKR